MVVEENYLVHLPIALVWDLYFIVDHFPGFLYRNPLIVVAVNQLLVAFRHHCGFDLHSMKANHYVQCGYLSMERYHFEYHELSVVKLIKNDH